ncbi:MAG: Flp family type IVb pilin [Ramlibacter sp.]|nr:Flp family type IVb pilin [Ramlibacter sp.]
MKKIKAFIGALAEEDDGAQVIEYALIVAVVALTLLIALKGILGNDVTGFVARVTACLSNAACT